VILLPDTITACLFDLDGVLTKTADIHRAAWKQTFDRFLRDRDPRLAPFDDHADYAAYVDGKKRADGVRDFLASRGIVLPEGAPDDPPGQGTVNAVGNAKNVLLLRLIQRDGVEVYDGSRRFVEAARTAGLRCAVVSSSANAGQVLDATALAPLFDYVVDGVLAHRRSLPGKPAPDTFLAAADELGVPAAGAAVFEDALAGVAAGRAGRFGYVVGVDRLGQADALRASGADVVVSDLEELL